MYLNLIVHGSIFTEGKNSTSKGGGEGRDVAVLGAPKAQTVTLCMHQNIICFLTLVGDMGEQGK
jgi:hypothetical protein